MDNPLEGLVETWKTADGTTVRIGDMSTAHVRNALRQLARDPAVARALTAMRMAVELGNRAEDAVEAVRDQEFNDHMSDQMANGG